MAQSASMDLKEQAASLPTLGHKIKYCLRQESFRKTIKSILTSHSSAHQFLMLPDNLSFMSKMKALSIAIFLISEFPVINP